MYKDLYFFAAGFFIYCTNAISITSEVVLGCVACPLNPGDVSVYGYDGY